MRKKICGIITILAILIISPVCVNASVDDVNSVFKSVNGNGGHVEVSECVLDENSKFLHLMVVQDANEGDGDTSAFCDKVFDAVKSFSDQSWYDYNYVIEDFVSVGYDGVITTAILDLKNDSRSWAAW